MNKDYIKADNWSIIEEGFEKENVKSSESLFSLGNGAMGQRANFEELYSGPTFQGSYIGGVYYPDKTRVGWWKNGYPEYFAKVINAPSWIGINVLVDGEALDLNTCSKVDGFRRELNMKEGWYQRRFTATLPNKKTVEVSVTRFLSLELDEVGAIEYNVTPVKEDMTITFSPYLDSGITNEDTNWDDKFWNTTKVTSDGNRAFIEAHTMKTNFETCTFMECHLHYKGKMNSTPNSTEEKELWIAHSYEQKVAKGTTASFHKFGGYTVARNHKGGNLVDASKKVLEKASALGFDALLDMQKKAWANIWEMSDITIEGDTKA
ncbi:MAG: glycoside hydrolase family 65 protein, partial [Eudoraea sp.]|nr:glycoside hydrolase family 65 protein [Eudoraea sp.]